MCFHYVRQFYLYGEIHKCVTGVIHASKNNKLWLSADASPEIRFLVSASMTDDHATI